METAESLRCGLADIVMITLIAVMVRANEWNNDKSEFVRAKEGRLRDFWVLPHGIPFHAMIQGIGSMIDGGVRYSLYIQFLPPAGAGT